MASKRVYTFRGLEQLLKVPSLDDDIVSILHSFWMVRAEAALSHIPFPHRYLDFIITPKAHFVWPSGGLHFL